MSENKTNENEVVVDDPVRRIEIHFAASGCLLASYEDGKWFIGSLIVQHVSVIDLLEALWKDPTFKVKRSKVTTVERTEELP